MISFALVGTGVAMLIGTFANNPDQAGSFGVFAGMLLGFVGGAVIPTICGWLCPRSTQV